MSAIIQTRMKYLQKQIRNIQNFLLQPSGLFETVDQVVKTFRLANRATMQELAVVAKRRGATAAGQIIAQGPLKRIVKRIREGIGGWG